MQSSSLCNTLLFFLIFWGKMQCMYAKNKIIHRTTQSKDLLGGQKSFTLYRNGSVTTARIVTLHTTWEHIVLTEQFRHYGILFMNTFHNVVNSLFTNLLFSQSPSSPHNKEQIHGSFLLASVFEKNEKKNKTTSVYRLCAQFYKVSSCTKKARASIVLNIE